MVKLTLPSSLFDMLPEDERLRRGLPRSVLLNPGSWEKLTREIQERFPLLAKRVLTESATIAAGFVLVVNGEVMQSGYKSLDFHSGDEIFIIAAIAGG